MKGIGDIQKMVKQAQEMQEKMQLEMSEMRVEGSSGGGMVTVVLDGHKNLVSLRIDPEVVNKDDVDMLQDLVLAAFNEAGTRVNEALSQKLGSLGAGLKIPGLF
jgi:DNA-binding YbaB/EbfC family protein